jgi:hypothetical protein
MADDKTKVGGQDGQRINIHEDYEVQDWTKPFGVSKDKLVEAVNAVGDRADDVREYLNR